MYLTGGRWLQSVYPEVRLFLCVKFSEVLNQFPHLGFALCTEGKGHLLISQSYFGSILYRFDGAVACKWLFLRRLRYR